MSISNNTQMEIAVATFFCCENLPDVAVNSYYFRRALQLARTVGNDLKLSGRMKVGGSLFKLNYRNEYKKNKETLLKEAHLFGITFLGDGATIARTPLMNVIKLSANTPLIVLTIDDVTEHKADEGMKNAEYMAKVFGDRMEVIPRAYLLTYFCLMGHLTCRRVEGF